MNGDEQGRQRALIHDGELSGAGVACVERKSVGAPLFRRRSPDGGAMLR
jgi:hypothetical protein